MLKIGRMTFSNKTLYSRAWFYGASTTEISGLNVPGIP